MPGGRVEVACAAIWSLAVYAGNSAPLKQLDWMVRQLQAVSMRHGGGGGGGPGGCAQCTIGGGGGGGGARAPAVWPAAATRGPRPPRGNGAWGVGPWQAVGGGRGGGGDRRRAGTLNAPSASCAEIVVG